MDIMIDIYKRQSNNQISSVRPHTFITRSLVCKNDSPLCLIHSILISHQSQTHPSPVTKINGNKTLDNNNFLVPNAVNK